MRILGIHGWGHDTAAALFDDYRLIAAVQEAPHAHKVLG